MPGHARSGSANQFLKLQRAAGNSAVAKAVVSLGAGSGPTGTTEPSIQREASRDQLLTTLRAAAAQGDWPQVAARLNGLSADDIRTVTAQLSLGQAANTRAAVLLAPGAWGQEDAILKGLNQGGGEVTRIGDLYAAYERGVRASNWAAAANAMVPMTREDILARLGKLTDEQRMSLRTAAAGRLNVLSAIMEFSRLPPGTTYADVKGDLAYIDNFETASYDVFRRELHLIYEDGREVPVPINQTQQRPPALSAKTQQKIAELEKNGQLTPPTSNAAGGQPGTPGFVTVVEKDVFYNDPQTGLLRPQDLRPAVAPRLFQAIREVDPDTQDLLFQASMAFVAGPPMPQGSEWFILLPIFARSGMAARQALAKRAAGKALTQAEAAELREVVTSGVGKRAYASSLGELEEAGVMKAHAPGAQLAPPKMRAVDWYEGGKQEVTVVKEKYKGKEIQVQQTHVSGGTWSQLHTVLEAKDATAANVSRAVTGKLNKFWDRLNNPSLSKPARDPVPIAPDTYRRVYLDKPEHLVVHIHLREAKATPELVNAANQALNTYAAKADLPPVTVKVTGGK